MTFVWDERELNPEQSAAVTHPGNVFLIACPGSGKTRTLTYKIAYELSKVTSQREFVLAITYTNRAANEIHERVEDMGVDSSQLWISTIHSFCLEWIIKPYSIYEPELSRGYAVIDLHDREILLETLCMPFKSQKVTFHDCDYYFTPSGYRLCCSDARKHPAIHSVLAQYFEYLSEHRLIDFELILWNAYRLLSTNSFISSNLSHIFKYILIDEYQDTKDLQYIIVASILKAGAGATALFMVGDPNQAIYESLGGYPISVAKLRELTRLKIDELELSLNYRSSERIIGYFENFNLNGTNIKAASKEKAYASIVGYDFEVSRENLVSKIIAIIKHNVEGLGFSPREVCVIAPWWVHLASTCRKLSVGLPEYSFDGPGMVPFSRDADNFWFKVARVALTEPAPGMYIRRLRWAKEILTDLDNAGVHLNGITSKDLLRIANSISILETDGLNFLQFFFASLFQNLGTDFTLFESLRQQHEAFFASSERKLAQLKKEGITTIDHVSYFRKLFASRSGITVSTIHGVKGAEFDVVIAYGLLDGMVPHFSDTNGSASAKKMLYVIGSRARKNLYLVSETGRTRYGNDYYQPTRELLECVFKYDKT